MFSQISLRMKLIVAFGAVILVSGAASVVSLKASAAVEQAMQLNDHSYEVVAAGDVVGTAMGRHSAERGYLLSGAPSFLATFNAGKKTFNDKLAELTELTRDEPAQQARLKALGDFARSWQEDVADQEQRLMSNPATVEEARKMELAGVGKSRMDAIRAKLNEIRDAERDLMNVRTAKLKSDLGHSDLSLQLGALLATLSAAAMCWLLTRSISAPVVAMTETMKSLAAGDNEVDVPAVGRKDEVGQMADAVQTFKDAAIEKLRLEAEAADQRRRPTTSVRATKAKRAAEPPKQQALVVDHLAAGWSSLPTAS